MSGTAARRSLVTTKSKPRRRSFGTSMGVTSIIAILVILVLVTFAALSVTTSKADLNLSQRTADSMQAYYKADSAAEEKYAQIAEAVKADPAGWGSEIAGLGVTVNGAAAQTITWTQPVDKARNLEIELTVRSGSVERTRWQVVPNGEWNPDNTLNLFTPGQ
ncbi:MAG: hypothetical protein FWF33_00790 [Clostridiales bacterium]|nr:hypothetical protein [Clostridiales bacterium]